MASVHTNQMHTTLFERIICLVSLTVRFSARKPLPWWIDSVTDTTISDHSTVPLALLSNAVSEFHTVPNFVGSKSCLSVWVSHNFATTVFDPWPVPRVLSGNLSVPQCTRKPWPGFRLSTDRRSARCPSSRRPRRRGLSSITSLSNCWFCHGVAFPLRCGWHDVSRLSARNKGTRLKQHATHKTPHNPVNLNIKTTHLITYWLHIQITTKNLQLQ